MKHSPSSLKTFLRCPMRYKLKYIDKIRCNYTNDAYSYLGQIYHKFLYHYYLEKSKGNGYRIFTNEYIGKIIDSVSLNVIFKTKETDINELKDYAFNNLIIPYLKKHPEVFPMVYKNKPSIEFELRKVPIVHPKTGEVIKDEYLQCKYDMITNDYEIVEFKLSFKPFDDRRIKTDIQMTIQSYVFEKKFNKKPKSLKFEFLSKENFKVTTKETARTDKDYENLFLLIKSIKNMEETNTWFRCLSGECRTCGFYNRCIGGKNE